MLANDPHTAQFISTELARHFVSDNPPQTLVDRMAGTYEKSGGDIRAVLKTMIYSPEFWSKEAYRAKIKTPFELVASTARALNADVEISLPLAMWVGRMGEPLFLCQPPTGYSDKSQAWVNTGALLNRLNFSLAFASGHLAGTSVNLAPMFGDEALRDPRTGAYSFDRPFPWRANRPASAANARRPLERSANFAGAPRRSGQASKRRLALGIGSRHAGISAAIANPPLV